MASVDVDSFHMLSWSFQNYLASQAAKTVRFDGSDSVFWHGSALGIAARGHVDHPQVWQIRFLKHTVAV